MISEQSKSNSTKIKEIMELYDELKDKIHDITHSQYTIHLLDSIFNRPIFKTSDLVRETKIHKQTAMSLLRELKKNGILKVIKPGSGRSAAILFFPRLVNIAEGRNIL